MSWELLKFSTVSGYVTRWPSKLLLILLKPANLRNTKNCLVEIMALELMIFPFLPRVWIF